MYKLHIITCGTGEEKIIKFDTFELAVLYRDYHLTFGNWSVGSKWINAKDLKENDKEYIVDEKFIPSESELKKYYKICTSHKIKIINENGNILIKEYWSKFREFRNFKLKETDWTQLPDNNLSVDEKKEYRKYRDYLRKLPTLHNDSTVKTAKVYDYEKWKKGYK